MHGACAARNGDRGDGRGLTRVYQLGPEITLFPDVKAFALIGTGPGLKFCGCAGAASSAGGRQGAAGRDGPASRCERAACCASEARDGCTEHLT